LEDAGMIDINDVKKDLVKEKVKTFAQDVTVL
jgi:hypothetical protein